MLQLARARPRSGSRTIGGLLALEGWRAGLSRVFRLWQREGLKVPQKKRKRRRLGVSANGCHRRRAESPNDVWCWDFIFDRTSSGSQLKWLSVIDEFTRECLTLKADRGITSNDVVDALAELFAMRGCRITSVATTDRSSLPTSFVLGSATSASRRSPSSPAAPGRTATPRAFTVASVTSAWPWRSSTASAMPGRSRQPGRTTTTTGGLTALLVFRPRPGSPPRVRHPPRPRPRLLPHTRLFAWVRPNPEPSYPLVQEIQAGQSFPTQAVSKLGEKAVAAVKSRS